MGKSNSLSNIDLEIFKFQNDIKQYQKNLEITSLEFLTLTLTCLSFSNNLLISFCLLAPFTIWFLARTFLFLEDRRSFPKRAKDIQSQIETLLASKYKSKGSRLYDLMLVKQNFTNIEVIFKKNYIFITVLISLTIIFISKM